MSRVALERRLYARRKAAVARMEAAGVDPSDAQRAMQAAYVVWSHRRRWIPGPLRRIAFDVFGRGFAAQFIARWKQEPGNG